MQDIFRRTFSVLTAGALTLGVHASVARADQSPGLTPSYLYVLDCFGDYVNNADVIYATAGATTYGTSGNDVIFGTSGPDQIMGYDGNDVICGGDGGDTIWGDQPVPSATTDADKIDGENGADSIYGGNGNDQLHGGAMDDEIWGDENSDTIYGGQGNDTIFCNGGPADWADGGTRLANGDPDVDSPAKSNGCETMYNIP